VKGEANWCRASAKLKLSIEKVWGEMWITLIKHAKRDFVER